jgi:hypothetical protein
MRVHEWTSLIHRAAEAKDDALITSLAQHLAECEEANSILRAKGYGASGTSIVDAVKMVACASFPTTKQ